MALCSLSTGSSFTRCLLTSAMTRAPAKPFRLPPTWALGGGFVELVSIRQAGVEVLVYGTKISQDGVHLGAPLPFVDFER